MCVQEVSSRSSVPDKAARLLAGVEDPLCRLADETREHLLVVLVAKHVKVFSRTGTQPFKRRLDEGDRHRIPKWGQAICRPFVSARLTPRAISRMRKYLVSWVVGISC